LHILPVKQKAEIKMKTDLSRGETCSNLFFWLLWWQPPVLRPSLDMPMELILDMAMVHIPLLVPLPTLLLFHSDPALA
jgi:hypothetical protein